MNTRMGRRADHIIGPWAAIGAGVGMLFGLLSGDDLPIALVIGAAVGLLVGLVVDVLAPPAPEHDADVRHF